MKAESNMSRRLSLPLIVFVCFAAFVGLSADSVVANEKKLGNVVLYVVDDPRHVDILATLQKKLNIWQRKTNDPWIVKYKSE